MYSLRGLQMMLLQTFIKGLKVFLQKEGKGIGKAVDLQHNGHIVSQAQAGDLNDLLIFLKVRVSL